MKWGGGVFGKKSGSFLNAACIMYIISIFFILDFTYLGGAYAPNAPLPAGLCECNSRFSYAPVLIQITFVIFEIIVLPPALQQTQPEGSVVLSVCFWMRHSPIGFPSTSVVVCSVRFIFFHISLTICNCNSLWL